MLLFFSPPKSCKLLKLSAPHQKAGDVFALRFAHSTAAAAAAAARWSKAPTRLLEKDALLEYWICRLNVVPHERAASAASWRARGC